jgi:hypothetical protein
VEGPAALRKWYGKLHKKWLFQPTTGYGMLDCVIDMLWFDFSCRSDVPLC